MLRKMVTLEGITKSYPGRAALSDISFSVTEGAIHALLGPNGAGKTTAMKIISGLLAPTDGAIYFNGKRDELPYEWRNRIGYLPENPPLYQQMRVQEYVKFVAELSMVDRKAILARVNETIERCDLTQVSKRMIGNLSKGYKQRVGLAQAIVSNPEILILDEPTVGLDPQNINGIREIIKSFKGKHTVLLSTHLLHEVDLLCTEATFIAEGRILKSGSLGEISVSLLQGKRVIFEVARWNDEIASNLEKRFNVSPIVTHDKYHRVTLVLNIGGREEVAHFLHQINEIPLSLIEEELTTEEIFNNLNLELKDDH